MRPKAATMSGAQGQLACVRSFRLRPPHVIRAAACSNSASTFPFTSLRIDARSPGAPRERRDPVLRSSLAQTLRPGPLPRNAEAAGHGGSFSPVVES
jgi:hypothetical protein